MATIFRCDRCKKESEKREDMRRIQLQRMNRTNFQTDDDKDTFSKDLCGTCWQKVVDLVEEKVPVLTR